MTCRVVITGTTSGELDLSFNGSEYTQFSSSMPASVEVESMYLFNPDGTATDDLPALALCADIGQTVATVPAHLICLLPSTNANVKGDQTRTAFNVSSMNKFFGQQVRFVLRAVSAYGKAPTWEDVAAASVFEWMVVLKFTPIGCAHM